MTIDIMKKTLETFVSKYSITKIVLFGSRAEDNYSETSDVDLIVEFAVPVSLITLSQLKIEIEEALGLDVDLIHGPIKKEDMIEVRKEIILYAA